MVRLHAAYIQQCALEGVQMLRGCGQSARGGEESGNEYESVLGIVGGMDTERKTKGKGKG